MLYNNHLHLNDTILIGLDLNVGIFFGGMVGVLINRYKVLKVLSALKIELKYASNSISSFILMCTISYTNSTIYMMKQNDSLDTDSGQESEGDASDSSKNSKGEGDSSDNSDSELDPVLQASKERMRAFINKHTEEKSNNEKNNLPDANVPASNLPDANVPASNLPEANVPASTPPGGNVPNNSGY
jgi:hypothetical protein